MIIYLQKSTSIHSRGRASQRFYEMGATFETPLCLGGRKQRLRPSWCEYVWHIVYCMSNFDVKDTTEFRCSMNLCFASRLIPNNRSIGYLLNQKRLNCFQGFRASFLQGLVMRQRRRFHRRDVPKEPQSRDRLRTLGRSRGRCPSESFSACSFFWFQKLNEPAVLRIRFEFAKAIFSGRFE